MEIARSSDPRSLTTDPDSFLTRRRLPPPHRSRPVADRFVAALVALGTGVRTIGEACRASGADECRSRLIISFSVVGLMWRSSGGALLHAAGRLERRLDQPALERASASR